MMMMMMMWLTPSPPSPLLLLFPIYIYICIPNGHVMPIFLPSLPPPLMIISSCPTYSTIHYDCYNMPYRKAKLLRYLSSRGPRNVVVGKITLQVAKVE